MKRCMMRVVFFITALAACFGAGKFALAGELAPLEIKAGKEVLVAKNIDPLPGPVWCRGSEILAYLTYYGLFYYDTGTGKTTFVAEEYSVPGGCIDDEWLSYSDLKAPDDDAVRRYEFKTGRRQKLVLAEDGNYIWRPVFNEDASASETAPLESDDTGDEPEFFVEKEGVLSVNVYKPEKKTVEIPHQYFWIFEILGTDNLGRLYLRIAGAGKNDRVDRCEVDIEGAKLSCQTVFDGNGQYDDLVLLSDKETMIFTRWGDTCVRAMRLGDDASKALCLTAARQEIDQEVSLSPDDKWLTFQVRRNADDGRLEGVDLYIRKLN